MEKKTFIEVAAEMGVVIDHVIEDGNIHRVPIEGKKPNNKSGAYAFFDDSRGRAGWIRNHITGELRKYGEQTESFHKNPITVADHQKQKEDKEKARMELHEQVAAETSLMMLILPNATDNYPYLVRKGVKAHQGLKIDQYKNLLIPLSNINGEIRSYQSIFSNGDKPYASGGEITGNFFKIGRIDDTLIICEGYSTGASIYESTGITTIIATASHNLAPVACKIHKKYPEIQIIIAADNDHHLKSNIGVLKASEAAELCGGVVVIPKLTAKERRAGYTDFNDIHHLRGKQAVYQQFKEYIHESACI